MDAGRGGGDDGQMMAAAGGCSSNKMRGGLFILVNKTSGMKSFHKYLCLLGAACLPVAGIAQSVDERVAEAMNAGAWHDLRRLYVEQGDSQQTPFLHPLSKFFLFHFYNRPDSALHYGGLLLERYQAELGESVPSTMYLMAEDCARLGDYAGAADLLHQLGEAFKQAGADTPPVFLAFEGQYRAMAGHGALRVERPACDVAVPMRYHNDDRRDPVMLFVPAELNGVACEVNYDTGAGANVMSQEMADRIGAYIAPVEGIPVVGVEKMASRFAIVDSVKLGAITLRNVPFQIIDFATGHDEADAKIEELGYECVLGSPTMLPLGEVRFDFAGRRLIIPAELSPKPAFAPNLYYSDNHYLILSVQDGKSGQAVEANLDTGAAFTYLTRRYYERNRGLFADAQPSDSLRMAGAGGVSVMRTVPGAWEYEAGGVRVVGDTVQVAVEGGEVHGPYDCLLGLPSLMRHDEMVVNFRDMWMSFR